MPICMLFPEVGFYGAASCRKCGVLVAARNIKQHVIVLPGYPTQLINFCGTAACRAIPHATAVHGLSQ